MTIWNYLRNHDNQYPLGSEHETTSEILFFNNCREELLEDMLKIMIKKDGKETYNLFREYCIEADALQHIFSPDGTGIGDQLINQA